MIDSFRFELAALQSCPRNERFDALIRRHRRRHRASVVELPPVLRNRSVLSRGHMHYVRRSRCHPVARLRLDAVAEYFGLPPQSDGRPAGVAALGSTERRRARRRRPCRSNPPVSTWRPPAGDPGRCCRGQLRTPN